VRIDPLRGDLGAERYSGRVCHCPRRATVGGANARLVGDTATVPVRVTTLVWRSEPHCRTRRARCRPSHIDRLSAVTTSWTTTAVAGQSRRERRSVCFIPVHPPADRTGSRHRESSRLTGDRRLLSALPDEDFRRILPHLKTVPLTAKQVLLKRGEPIRYVYFPNGGVCSVTAMMKDGAAVEVTTVGTEGMIGIAGVLRRTGHAWGVDGAGPQGTGSCVMRMLCNHQSGVRPARTV